VLESLTGGSLAHTRLEDIERLVAINARIPFLMMKGAVIAVADGGRVVNISADVTGTVRPGWSSSDGGSEESPEFRDAARSSLATRPPAPRSPPPARPPAQSALHSALPAA